MFQIECEVFMENIKNEPKDIIGKAETKSEISTKIVSNDKFIDPYGGHLKKTNYLLLGLVVSCSILFVVCMVWIGYITISCAINNVAFHFIKISKPMIIIAIDFVLLVIFAILKAIVEKKRINCYSSTHETKQLKDYKPHEISTEKAKLGQSTTETTLTISDTKESFKFCPHCRQRIPESSGMFCPKCGKRMDVAPLKKD